eukprot:scaffold6731_cov181-Skeletonema_marinoi.AAC.3
MLFFSILGSRYARTDSLYNTWQAEDKYVRDRTCILMLALCYACKRVGLERWIRWVNVATP